MVLQKIGLHRAHVQLTLLPGAVSGGEGQRLRVRWVLELDGQGPGRREGRGGKGRNRHIWLQWRRGPLPH